MQTATLLTVAETHTDGPIVRGEVREGLPGSTLERGTHVEKRSGTWETLRVPGLKREYETAAAWHTVSEPTPAETQTQAGRSLNSGDAGFIRQTG